jgi:hypothetical protein
MSGPTTLATVKPDGIPAELQTLRQWVTWHAEWNPKRNRWNKIPTNPHTVENASTTNPKTWGSFAQALDTHQYEHSGTHGIGFVFTESDPFIGIDLDHCRDAETGEITAAALAIVARLDTYTEPSVSGTGLHLIARGTLPAGCKSRIDNAEVYESGRFFVFTGQPLAGHDAIHERTAALESWHRETAKPKPAPRQSSPTKTTHERTASADDSKIVERVRRTAKGARLLAGDWNGYASASEGDMTLANLFASAGVTELEQGARLLAAYSLVAEDKAARVDYIPRTVAKALADVSPWDGWDTPILTAHGTPAAEPIAGNDSCSIALAAALAQLATVTAERDEARRTISGLIGTFLNPHMTETEKVTLIATINLAERKTHQGETRPDGSIELSAAEISDDWRPVPPKGESLQPANANGSKPRMPRKSVKATVETLVDRGMIQATPRETFTARAGGATYKGTGWDIAPTEKPVDVLAWAAAWQPEQPKQRKVKAQSTVCPHCGEVHAIRRQDACTGCGTLRREIVIQPTDYAAVEPEPTAAPYVDKLFQHIDTPLFVATPMSTNYSNIGTPPEPTRAPLAAAWFAGEPAPPADRWTDTMTGR